MLRVPLLLSSPMPVAFHCCLVSICFEVVEGLGFGVHPHACSTGKEMGSYPRSY